MKCETAMLQNKKEIDQLISILSIENVKSYLEVGSKFGGSLWRVANRLPRGSRIVSVDLPHGDKSFKESQAPLEECVRTLKSRGYDAHLILGDSTDADVVDKVYALGPFDACFLDGNHTMPYIEKDFANFGKITKILAMHDIGFFRKGGLPPHKKPIEVPEFWNTVKTKYPKRHEIRCDPQDNGIGVLWL